MSEEIEVCPFCGKDADYQEDEDFISCLGTEGGCGFYYNVEGELDEAIKTWNRREPYTELSAEMERLESGWSKETEVLHQWIAKEKDLQSQLDKANENNTGLSEIIKEMRAQLDSSTEPCYAENIDLRKRVEDLEAIRDRLRAIKKAARAFVYCNDEADALFLNGFGSLKKALEVSDAT